MNCDPEKTPEGELSRTILVIEDSDDLREVLIQLLGLAGFEAVGFRDAESGLEELEARRCRPRAIVLDLGMPAMSGEEFLRDRRNVPGLAHVPVVVVTGRHVPREAMLALGVV